MDYGMTLYIDPDTGDLDFADDDIKTITDDEAIAQCVRVTLETWLGEWTLDERHGTNYQRIISEDLTDAQVRDIISAAIYQEPQVQRITALKVSRSGRELVVAFTALLKSGKTIESEVITSG
jgi:phage baseplate assembly protein W